MTSVRKLHDEAMSFAQMAMVARHQGEFERARQLALKACKLEADAAARIPIEMESEPTRSILFRSAATLAYQAKDFQVAEQLVFQGLSGYPPDDVAQELKDLYDQLNFEHHLKLRNVYLDDADVQMVLQGNAVGSGTILFNEFNKRVTQTYTLINRTVQRLMDREYQSSGRIPKAFKPFEQAISAPRSGSFAVTIKLIPTDGQMPMFISAKDVISEVIHGFELIQADNEQELREQIGQEQYYRHFVNVARDMAPDGDRIKLVGFTSSSESVSFTRTKQQIPTAVAGQSDSEEQKSLEPIEVVGILDFASLRTDNVVGLTTDDGQEYSIKVEAGMDDIVTSYWNNVVRVRGNFDGMFVFPLDISSED